MARKRVKKIEQRSTPRYGVTIQLVYGVDDDLIDLIQNTAQGDRQTALKTALRRALDLPDPTAPPLVVETLSADVEQRLNGIQAQLDMMHMIQGNGADNGASDDIDQMRHELNRLSQLVQQLSAAINTNGAALVASASDTPKASAEQMQKRARRLDKTNW